MPNRHPHWPGPWSVEERQRRLDPREPQLVSARDNGGGIFYVANVRSGITDDDYDYTLGNARLIAAAPDLLEACEQVVAGLDNEALTEAQEVEIFAYVRAAVEKAKGIEPPIDADTPAYTVEGEGEQDASFQERG